MNLKICYLTCHKIPRLRRNLHIATAWLTLLFAENTQHEKRPKCCACHAKWRWRSPKCCACHENCNSSSEIDAKILRLPHVGMSQSATPATRNEAMMFETFWNKIFETSKSDNFCRTPHWYGHTDLTRRLADGCERLRSLNPQTPKWNGNPCYAFGKKTCAMTLMTLPVSSPCSWELIATQQSSSFLRPIWRRVFFFRRSVPKFWRTYLGDFSGWPVSQESRRFGSKNPA